MQDASLDKFTPYSNRSAASSCAVLLGLPIDSILKQAGWTTSNTFIRHYMKGPETQITNNHAFSKNWEPENGGERLINANTTKIKKFKQIYNLSLIIAGPTHQDHH